ncbi:hypothetical protein GRI91_09035 [Altererythrobacter endophyticus]|uniref:Uncharacterized protein n=2 Tax=Altericroceibacterium endophyticum TaxID=1808508 RepID=A0A6I4T5E5_9SPHN|nr:hypothetical protein [Altericroceibacterium endophyticum]
MISGLGYGLTVVAAALVYLGSSNQPLLASRRWRGMLPWVGIAGLVAAFVLLLRDRGAVTTSFILVTLAMLTWSFLPVMVGWFMRGKGKGR